jgi:hypothetical protein
MAIAAVVRASDKFTLERRTSGCVNTLETLAQNPHSALGAACWLAGRGPAAAPASPRRGFPVETGTVARTYPWSAGTLTLAGGVPLACGSGAGISLDDKVHEAQTSVAAANSAHTSHTLGAFTHEVQAHAQQLVAAVKQRAVQPRCRVCPRGMLDGMDYGPYSGLAHYAHCTIRTFPRRLV